MVLLTGERKVEQVPDLAMCSISSDEKSCRNLRRMAVAFQRGAHLSIVLHRIDQLRLVFDASAPLGQRFRHELFRHVLRNHSDEWIRRIAGCKMYSREWAPAGNDSDPGDRIAGFEKGLDDTGHIENFERSREDRERLRVDRLGGTRLDEAPTQAAARTLVGEKQSNGSRTDDENVA